MKNLSIALLTLFLLIGCSGKQPSLQNKDVAINTAVDDYTKGLEAYKKRDYRLAFYLWEPLAYKGDGRAQYKISNMYKYGKGVGCDNEEYLRWSRKAYASNMSAACIVHFLGICIDDSNADPEVQNALGEAYHYGHGDLEMSWRTAARWYRKAAEKGQADAQYKMAWFYSHGRTGYRWNTNAGIGKNKEKAFYWYKKAAEQGQAEAQYSLGSFYLNGNSVKMDKKQAFNWWLKAAQQNHSGAQYNLGMAYVQSIGTEQDFNKSVYWYKKSYAQGFHLAKGEAERIEKELIQRKLRAEQGDAQAQYEMGLIYQRAGFGYRVAMDLTKACTWFVRSANQNYAPAQSKLGDMYRYGLVVEVDYHEALEWYKKSAAQGDKEGQKRLLRLQDKMAWAAKHPKWHQERLQRLQRAKDRTAKNKEKK